jgi:hypothetical protein
MDGSSIAKSGFIQEDLLVDIYNKNPDFRKKIFQVLNISENSVASKISGKKHDIKITSQSEKISYNIQVKRYSGQGFNQVDKRWVFEWEQYLSADLIPYLEKFTGACFWPAKQRCKPFEFGDEFKSKLSICCCRNICPK